MPEIRRAIRVLDTSEAFQAPAGELSIVFLDDERIARLHGDFMGEPTPTDVITFEGDSAMDFAGEVCVSVDHAHNYSKANKVPFSRELMLYLVHGYLHLCGFDDLTEEDAAKMRQAEKKALSILESSGVLPKFDYSEKSPT